jgi:putative membrane protein
LISLLLVFSTNTAYGRWREGRKLLGEWLNNSRNLALKLTAIFKNDALHKEQARIITGNYAPALVEHLSEKHQYFVLKDHEAYPINEVLQAEHKPNAVALQLMNFITALVDKKRLTPNDILFLKYELSRFTEIIGACERIKKSPIRYNLFIKKFIFVYIMTIPLFFSQDFGYAIVLLTIFIFYVLVSIEMIAEEIEDPFNGDSNDLPMHDIAQNIRRNIKEIFHQ